MQETQWSNEDLLGTSPGKGYYVFFSGKTLYLYSASLTGGGGGGGDRGSEPPASHHFV